jgi:hypothetical protein
VTTATAIGGHAGAGPLDAAHGLLADALETRSAGERRVELLREPVPVVLHDGQLLLEIGERQILVQPTTHDVFCGLERGLEAVERRGEGRGQLGVVRGGRHGFGAGPHCVRRSTRRS